MGGRFLRYYAQLDILPLTDCATLVILATSLIHKTSRTGAINTRRLWPPRKVSSEMVRQIIKHFYGRGLADFILFSAGLTSQFFGILPGLPLIFCCDDRARFPCVTRCLHARRDRFLCPGFLVNRKETEPMRIM